MSIFTTKLTDEEKEKLREQRRDGLIARQAWDAYLKALLHGRREHIFDAFRKTRVDDVDAVITLRHLLAAVDDIEQSVLIDIERGDYAAKQLNEDQTND